MQFNHKRFKELFKSKGLTQQGMADLVGVSQGAVCAWLQANKTPRLNHITLIGKALDVKPEGLIILDGGAEFDTTHSDHQELFTDSNATPAHLTQDEIISSLNQVIGSLASGCRHTTAICHIAAIIQDMGGDL